MQIIHFIISQRIEWNSIEMCESLQFTSLRTIFHWLQINNWWFFTIAFSMFCIIKFNFYFFLLFISCFCRSMFSHSIFIQFLFSIKLIIQKSIWISFKILPNKMRNRIKTNFLLCMNFAENVCRCDHFIL